MHFPFLLKNRLYFFLLSLLFIFSCKSDDSSSQEKTENQVIKKSDTLHKERDSVKLNENIEIIEDSSLTEDQPEEYETFDLIKDMSRTEFLDMRKQLQLESEELGYIFGELKDDGSYLTYSVEIPENEMTMSYSCDTKLGSLTVITTGKTEEIGLLFNNAKNSEDQMACKKSEIGEVCSYEKRLDEFKILSKYKHKLQYINENYSVYSFFRVLQPE